MGRIRIIPKGRGRILAPPFTLGAPDTSRQMCADVDKASCLDTEINGSSYLSADVDKASCPEGNVGQAVAARTWINVFDIAQIFLQSFYVEGNHSSEFNQADVIQIIDSDRADGYYTVIEVWYCSGNNRTRIKVEESIPTGPTDGLSLLDVDFSPFRVWVPAKLYDKDYHCGDLSCLAYKGQMCCEIERAECT